MRNQTYQRVNPGLQTLADGHLWRGTRRSHHEHVKQEHVKHEHVKHEHVKHENTNKGSRSHGDSRTNNNRYITGIHRYTVNTL